MRTPRPRSRARRTAVVLLATGVACLGGAALPLVAAQAGDEPGSGFGMFSLAANAPVMQFRVDYPAQYCTSQPAGGGACEGVLNESVSTLRNGPVGHALSSFAWPGSLAGGLGSLLIVAGGAPSQATVLNDPVKAENFSNSKADTVTNSQVPGVTMTATATSSKVAASSTILDTSKVPAVGTLGQVTSSSSTELTGASSAVSTAHSVVQDITLGPLHIGTIRSDATASTNGKAATASGGTTVLGATVNDVPVTIDSQGVHVAGQGTGLPTQVTDGVNTALTQAGMSVSVSTPIGKPEGPNAVYNAGSLVLVWSPPNSGTTFTLMFGGAQVAVAASQGYSFNLGSFDGGTTGTGTPAAPAAAPAPPSAPLGVGGPGVPAGVGTGSVPPPALGSTPLAPAVAASREPLPHGLSPALVGLAVVGAGLVAAGLRRLPDRVLVAPASSCPQGEPA